MITAEPLSDDMQAELMRHAADLSAVTDAANQPAWQQIIEKPPVDCPDILDRLSASHRALVDELSRYCIVLPNGDVIYAYRGLRMHEIEQEMLVAEGRALDRLRREYRTLAPGGESLVVDQSGRSRYGEPYVQTNDPTNTVFEFVDLPPIAQRPAGAQPETRRAFLLFGSSLPEHQATRAGHRFDAHNVAGEWVLGSVSVGGDGIPEPVAVYKPSTLREDGDTQKPCVLWPVGAAETQSTVDPARELFVALHPDTHRATPAELACAVEQGRVSLTRYTARSARFRETTTVRVRSGMVGYTEKQVETGPGRKRVSWSATPIRIRIVDHDRHLALQQQRLEREDGPPAASPEDDRATDNKTHTHAVVLKDGRTLRGRLTSKPYDAEIAFVVIVGTIEQPMTFDRSDILRIDRLTDSR
ncbi:MAG: hypothetical protein AAFR96_10705 [Planctomycetota bacterium]